VIDLLGFQHEHVCAFSMSTVSASPT